MSELPTNPSESVRRRNPHLYIQPKSELTGLLVKSIQVERQKRIRQSQKPLMNKLELEYWGVLKRSYTEGPDRIVCQGLRFQLANGLWYKPDFAVFTFNALWCYEVKGPHAFRGGFENLKVAARTYPFITWVLVWKETTWKEQIVLP